MPGIGEFHSTLDLEFLRVRETVLHIIQLFFTTDTMVAYWYKFRRWISVPISNYIILRKVIPVYDAVGVLN